MAGKITIRAAKISDLEAVFELSRKIFLHQRENFDKTLAVEWLENGGEKKYLAKSIKGPKGCVFVACDGENIIGYIEGWIYPAEPAFRVFHSKVSVVNFFVDEKYRAGKIGSRLMENFVSWAGTKNVDIVTVDPYVANLRAIKFYRRHGFADYSLYMERRLSGKE